MKARTTDIDADTRVRITQSEDPDFIGLTGTITHPFEGIVLPDVKYIAGIRVDQKGRFTDDIANLVEGDKFEILENIPDSSEFPRKWEYIATRLKEFNAPNKVHNAAIEIDNAMVRLGLGYHTGGWVMKYPICLKYPPSMHELYSLISDFSSCTACEDCKRTCMHCKLGCERHCTPRSKHADQYYNIVRQWVVNEIFD